MTASGKFHSFAGRNTNSLNIQENDMDAMKKAIINMWNKGMSSSAIAQATGKTRNAIMGLIFRAREKNIEGIRFSVPKPAAIKKAPVKKEPTLPKPKKISVSKVRIPLTFEPPKNDKKIRIFDLTHSSCRYIVSDTDGVQNTFYCGETKDSGAYCAYHAQLCYVSMATYKKMAANDPPTRSRFAFGNT